jgi:peroxiredoxin
MRSLRYGVTFLVSAAVGAGVFLGAIGLMRALSTTVGTSVVDGVPRVGSVAPGFTLQDPDGRTVKLSDFRGKPAVIVFWADWCPDCKAAIPDFNELQRKGVQVLAINLLEDAGRVSSAVQDGPIQYRVALDPSGDVGRAYGVNALPNVFVLNANGVIVDHRYSAPNIDSLR